MKRYPRYREFRAAAQSEWDKQFDMGTFKWIKNEDVPKNEQKLLPRPPLTWVFKYKTDENGYYVRDKARLCARGDLQSNPYDTYAATVAA